MVLPVSLPPLWPHLAKPACIDTFQLFVYSSTVTNHKLIKTFRRTTIMTHLLSLMLAIKARLNREEGQGMAEYALIIALVAILLVTALTDLKDGIAGVFATIVAAFG
jgi:pilus assembly protein Flp/PilA